MRPERCPTCHRLQKRSTQANARMWLLLHEIASTIYPKGHVFSAESWHAYFKQRFLGCDEVKMPNGKTIQMPRSSADLDTAAFHEYVTQVEAWAAEHGVYLQDLAA